MPNYEYMVVPFIGTMKSGQSASQVSTQLENVINQHGAQGWEFDQLNDVNIEVQPGCLAGLFGAQSSYIKFDQLIFRRESARNTQIAVSPASQAIIGKPKSAEPRGQVPADKRPLGLCPNCEAEIPLDSQECPICKASFGPNSTWSIKPLSRTIWR